MNTEEILGLRAGSVADCVLTISFPITPSKQGYAEIFSAMETYRSVVYHWKYGILIVEGCKDVRAKHVDLAKALGVYAPTSFDMIRLLSASGIRVKVKSYEDYFDKGYADYLDSLYHELYELPRAKIDEVFVKMLYGIISSHFDKPIMTSDEYVYYSNACVVNYTEEDKKKMLEVIYANS